jgi:hypothetical protein
LRTSAGGSGTEVFRDASAENWLQGLVLGLLEALTANEHKFNIATVVDMGNLG